MNELLAISSHWTEPNIKLILNSKLIPAEFYLDEIDTLGGPVRRANPAKVEIFLAMGASLVANSVEEIAPEIRDITAELGHQFAGRSGANIYLSSAGIQAFQSHCDLHEVFAVQCEGEKVWNVYRNRANAPVEQLNTDDAQATIDRHKGPVALKAVMRPGDVLYIPRGFYHDALASSGASLHVTFAVLPLTGRILFQMLHDIAVEDEEFRQYLPDARVEGGAVLAAALGRLADRISQIGHSERFKSLVAVRQRELWEPSFRFRLPEKEKLDFYARSEQPAQVVNCPDGARLATLGGEFPLGPLGVAAEWLLTRPAFSMQELLAQFRQLPQADLRELVAKLQSSGVIYRYEPELS
jgi:hypothetical protein